MAAITPATNPEMYVNGGKKQTSATGLSGDFSFFLKMLTTQLKNQDPTAPMDVSQMTQQIAQYSGVEQQVKTNTILEQMIASNAAVAQQSQLSSALGYIGKEVETEGNNGTLQNGQATFAYMLEKDSYESKVTIKDGSGNIVYEGIGTNNKGRNLVLWDGKDADGRPYKDGLYTISVASKDASNKAVKATTRSVWYVDSMETGKDGKIFLNTLRQQIEFDDVLAVRPAVWVDLGGGEGEEDETNTGNNGSGNDTVAGNDSGTDSAS